MFVKFSDGLHWCGHAAPPRHRGAPKRALPRAAGRAAAPRVRERGARSPRAPRRAAAPRVREGGARRRDRGVRPRPAAAPQRDGRGRRRRLRGDVRVSRGGRGVLSPRRSSKDESPPRPRRGHSVETGARLRYSAAFLCSRAVMLKHQVPETRLHKGVGNMEGASNFMFKKNRLLKTVDMFDFFIEHLSWYGRPSGTSSVLALRSPARGRRQQSAAAKSHRRRSSFSVSSVGPGTSAVSCRTRTLYGRGRCGG